MTVTTTMTTLNGPMLAELAREGATTRRVLERVPEEKLTWSPHPKSMSLGTLALHVAMIPGAIADLVAPPVHEVPTFTPPEGRSRDEILAALERSLSAASARLASWTDEYLNEEWKLVSGSQVIMALPRIDMLRSVMLNHWYHHRGQLLVYLRLLDVPVPFVYGPSADERPF